VVEVDEVLAIVEGLVAASQHVSVDLLLNPHLGRQLLVGFLDCGEALLAVRSEYFVECGLYFDLFPRVFLRRHIHMARV
jgi:hypothetical protein